MPVILITITFSFISSISTLLLTDETSSTLRLKPKPKSTEAPSIALNLLFSLLSSISAVLFLYINVAFPHVLELSSLRWQYIQLILSNRSPEAKCDTVEFMFLPWEFTLFTWQSWQSLLVETLSVSYTHLTL